VILRTSVVNFLPPRFPRQGTGWAGPTQFTPPPPPPGGDHSRPCREPVFFNSRCFFDDRLFLDMANVSFFPNDDRSSHRVFLKFISLDNTLAPVIAPDTQHLQDYISPRRTSYKYEVLPSLFPRSHTVRTHSRAFLCDNSLIPPFFSEVLLPPVTQSFLQDLGFPPTLIPFRGIRFRSPFAP